MPAAASAIQKPTLDIKLPPFHAAVNTIMSRRIKDLAREFNCLGFFDDDDDRPRAA